jgi:hypothetical protein
MGIGIVLAVVGIVSIAFSAKQAVELNCPHCGGKVVPRVTSSTSQLYLSKAEGEGGPAQEETKGTED